MNLLRVDIFQQIIAQQLIITSVVVEIYDLGVEGMEVGTSVQLAKSSCSDDTFSMQMEWRISHGLRLGVCVRVCVTLRIVTNWEKNWSVNTLKANVSSFELLAAMRS